MTDVDNPRPRRYGPHDHESASMLTVTVGLPGRYAGTADVPFPPAILRQREQLNTLAAAGFIPRPDLRREPVCRTCARPASRCIGGRPNVHARDVDDHVFDPPPS